jgi:hypothetical protein
MDCLCGDVSCLETCKKHETKNGRVSPAIKKMKELAAAQLTFLKNNQICRVHLRNVDICKIERGLQKIESCRCRLCSLSLEHCSAFTTMPTCYEGICITCTPLQTTSSPQIISVGEDPTL